MRVPEFEYSSLRGVRSKAKGDEAIQGLATQMYELIYKSNKTNLYASAKSTTCLRVDLKATSYQL